MGWRLCGLIHFFVMFLDGGQQWLDGRGLDTLAYFLFLCSHLSSLDDSHACCAPKQIGRSFIIRSIRSCGQQHNTVQHSMQRTLHFFLPTLKWILLLVVGGGGERGGQMLGMEL